MPDPHQAVIGGIDCHTDFHVRRRARPFGPGLGHGVVPGDGCWLPLGPHMARVVRPDRRGRCRVHRILRRGFDPIAGRAGLPRDRDQPAAPASARPSRQERRHRRRGRRPQGALGRSDRSRQGHHRHRRGDPPGSASPETAPSRPAPPRCANSATCSSPPPPRCASNSTPAGPSRAKPPCAPDCTPTPTASPIPPRPPKQRCAVSAAASPNSALKPPSSRANSTGWSPPQRPPPCHASDPALTTPLPLLVAAGENIDRLGSEASFAHLCATAPVPASSGRTSRHRLNYPGNRAANRALHMIVLVRLPLLRTNPQLHGPPPRRTQDQKEKPSAASNASSPASSTAPSEPTSPPSQPALDIYRNVPGRFRGARDA